MTLLEKAMELGLEETEWEYVDYHCPGEFFNGERMIADGGCYGEGCEDCWNREWKGETE